MALLPLGQVATASFDDGAGAIEFEVTEDQQLVSVKLSRTGPGENEALSQWQAEAAMGELWSDHVQSIRSTRVDEHEARTLVSGDHTMPFWYTIYGEKPAGGRSLYISMHGGGGAPAEVNDSQWEHMQIYYRDQPEQPGYRYLALRAPNDTWNGFYTGYVWPLIEALIRQEVRYAAQESRRPFESEAEVNARAERAIKEMERKGQISPKRDAPSTNERENIKKIRWSVEEDCNNN